MSSVFSSWTSLRRTPYQSLTALLVVITTFFIVYLFSTLMYAGARIIAYFETRPQILVFYQVEKTDAEATQDAELLGQLEYVAGVQIIGKNEAFANYKRENQNEPLLLELLTADLFPVSLSITATSPDGLEKIRTEISKLDLVDEVDYRQDVIEQFLSWTNLIRAIGLAACILFTVQFVLVIIVITSMKVANRRRRINIMSILGAHRGKIRGTFVREGMWLGLLGSLLSFGLIQALLVYFEPVMVDFLGEIEVFPLPVAFLVIQVTVGSALAAFLASVSAWIATTRLIRK
jgi:cell division transport system permease protein